MRAGKKITVLARVEAGRIRFALREGVGEAVGRPPWKASWGGGASVENPHVQASAAALSGQTSPPYIPPFSQPSGSKRELEE